MKLLDRALVWVLSVLSAALGIFLLLLVLFPSLGWLSIDMVRLLVGVLALVSILAAAALLMRSSRRQSRDAALVSDGEDGSAYVTLNVINDMARKIAQDTQGVRSCRSAVRHGAEGVDVELELSLKPGVAVAPMAARLQERLKGRIFEMTGIPVGKVSILVEAAAEAAAGQPIVRQLPDGSK